MGGWGKDWEELVGTYVAIERCAGFEEKGRLPKATEGKPPEVAAWMGVD